MSRRYRVRQNPALSAFAAIGSIVFLFAGCAMMNPGGMSMSAPVPFQLLWVVACLATFCVSIYNAASDKGIATEIIQEDFSENDPADEESGSTKSASLLRELEDLKTQNLISEDEYQEKRRGILSRFD